jgi:hypothetical membrane protein
MNASFIILGMTILLGAVLIRGAFRPGRMWAVGLSLVALAGLGLIAVGLFPENTHIAAHTIGAGAQFISGNLGLVVLGAATLQARRSSVVAIYSIASGVVGLLATALFVSDQYWVWASEGWNDWPHIPCLFGWLWLGLTFCGMATDNVVVLRAPATERCMTSS